MKLLVSYDISTLEGYLIPNPVYKSYIFNML